MHALGKTILVPKVPNKDVKRRKVSVIKHFGQDFPRIHGGRIFFLVLRLDLRKLIPILQLLSEV